MLLSQLQIKKQCCLLDKTKEACPAPAPSPPTAAAPARIKHKSQRVPTADLPPCAFVKGNRLTRPHHRRRTRAWLLRAVRQVGTPASQGAVSDLMTAQIALIPLQYAAMLAYSSDTWPTPRHRGEKPDSEHHKISVVPLANGV